MLDKHNFYNILYIETAEYMSNLHTPRKLKPKRAKGKIMAKER